MASETQEETQLRRARAGLAEALAQRDAEGAVAHLLRLPPAERTAPLPATAALLHADAAKSWEAGKWNRLVFWAVRLEREPGLAPQPAEAAALRWSLLWGCVRCREWSRARGLLDALAPQLPEPLAQLIDALISSQGAPEALTWARLSTALPPPDPRLGYEPLAPAKARLLAPPAPPAAESEVEPRLLALFASPGPLDRVAVVTAWVEASAGPVRVSLLLQAAALLAGDLLRGAGTAALAGPARFIARASQDTGSPQALQAEVSLALRAVASWLPAVVTDRAQAELLLAVGRAAAAYPALRGQVEGSLLGHMFEPGCTALALELAAALLAKAPSLQVWLKAVLLLHHETGSRRQPSWLEPGLVHALAQAADLLQALQALELDRAQVLLCTVVERAPLPLAEQLLELLWTAEPVRPVAASAFEALFDRVSPPPPPADQSQAMARLKEMARAMGLPLRELERMKGSPMVQEMLDALEQGDEDEREVTPQGRALWQRFAARLVPHGIQFLQLALEVSESDAEDERAVALFLSRGREPGKPKDMSEAFAAIRQGLDQGCEFAVDDLTAALPVRFAGQPEQLARGLQLAERIGAPRSLLVALARGLQLAAEKGPLPAELAGALQRARRILPPAKLYPRSKKPKPAAKAKPKPVAPPMRAAPGAAFDAAMQVQGCIAWLPSAFAKGTATAYAGHLRRLLESAKTTGKLAGLTSAAALLEEAERFWQAIEKAGKAAGPPRAAVGALKRYTWLTRPEDQP